LANIAASPNGQYQAILMRAEAHDIAILSLQRHPRDARVQERGMALLAHLAEHDAAAVARAGALPAARSALKLHLGVPAACLCLYHIARKCPDGVGIVVSSGAAELVSPSVANGLMLLKWLVTHGSPEQQQDSLLSVLVGGHVQELYDHPLRDETVDLRAALEAYPVQALKPLLRTDGDHHSQVNLTIAMMYLTGLKTVTQLEDFLWHCQGLDRLLHLLAAPEKKDRVVGARAIVHLLTVTNSAVLDSGPDQPSHTSKLVPAPCATNFAHHFDNPDESDIRFLFQDGESLNAHKVLLSSAMGMDVYSAIVSHRTCSPTSQSGVFNITDVSYQAFACMVCFLYTGSMFLKEERENIDSPFLAEVFMVAERYQIEPLQLTCAGVLVKHLRVHSLLHVWYNLHYGQLDNSDIIYKSELTARSNVQEFLREDIAIFVMRHLEETVQLSAFPTNRTWLVPMIRQQTKSLLGAQLDHRKSTTTSVGGLLVEQGGQLVNLMSGLLSWGSASTTNLQNRRSETLSSPLALPDIFVRDIHTPP